MSAKMAQTNGGTGPEQTGGYWTATVRYPQTRLTLVCEEHPDADLLRYKTGPNSTWVQCTECGSLLDGD